MESNKDFYKNQLRYWSQQDENNLQNYYEKFLENIESKYNIKIIYDELIWKQIAKLLQQTSFLQFDSVKYKNKNKQILIKIGLILVEKQFIHKRNKTILLSTKKDNLEIKCVAFLNKIKSIQQVDITTFNQKFKQILGVKLGQFWKIIDRFNINNSVIQQIAKLIHQYGPQSQQYQQAYYTINKIKTQLQQKKQDNTKIITEKVIKKITKNNKLPPKQQNQNKYVRIYSIINLKIHNNKQVQFLQKGFLSPNNLAYLLELQNTVKEYVTKILYSSYSSVYNKKLAIIGYHCSLFYNKNNTQTLKYIAIFIKYLQKLFNVKFNIFGSLKNTLALTSQFDIDLDITPLDSAPRPQKPQYKQASHKILKQLIQDNSQELNKQNWFIKHKLYNFSNLKVVLLQLKTKQQKIEQLYKVKLINKIDITANNSAPIFNCKLLFQYAKHPSILVLCILIKLWAKKNQIINSVHPVQGIPSYGVSLMVLFYLMHTKQIPFINKQQKQQFLKTSRYVLREQNVKLKQLINNFQNFLQFYSQKGSCRKQKLTICLLQPNSYQFKYKQDKIFNIYDFIDNNQPASRLQKVKQQFFNNKFEDSINLLNQSFRAQSIRQLFQFSLSQYQNIFSINQLKIQS